MTADVTSQLPAMSSMLRLTFEKWYNDDIPRHAAVLAFYALFALAPILLFCVEIWSLIFGRAAAEEQVVRQVSSFLDNDATSVWVGAFLENILPSSASLWVTTGFVLALLYGASSFFYELQVVLNKIWDVYRPEELTFVQLLVRRGQAVLMVLAFSLFVFMGLLVSSWLSTATENLGSGFAQWSYLLLLFLVLTLLFGLIYKYVPDIEIGWQDVWIGAAATAFLISVTRVVIGLYFGYSHTTTMFGAAAAIVVILLSVYYSAQIFFLGAEFACVLSQDEEQVVDDSQTGTADRLKLRADGRVKLTVMNVESSHEPTVAPIAAPAPEAEAVAEKSGGLWQRIRSIVPNGSTAPLRPSSTGVAQSEVTQPEADLQRAESNIEPQKRTLRERLPRLFAVRKTNRGKESLSERSRTSIEQTTHSPTAPSVSNAGQTTDTPTIGKPKSPTTNHRSPFRFFRSVRQIFVAVGVIGALSFGALIGLPFWRKKGKSAPADQHLPIDQEDV